MSSRVAFVVMAGGKGERLWPLVRASVPKACVSLDGTRTLLEATLARLRGVVRTPHPQLLIVTTASQARPIQQLLPPSPRRSLVIEPEGKNTAACLTLAAAALAARDPRTVMAVVPADHWLAPTDAFHRSLRAAIDLAARREEIVTIGLRPTRVHPGLGHLCVGPAIRTSQGARAFPLMRFIEKPSPATAQQLMRHHRVYWNAGIFVGRVGTFLGLIRRWLPEHAARLIPLGALVGRPQFARRAAAAYRRLAPVSFDVGVMAHRRSGFVVEGAFDWEDVGSWESWVRISPARHTALTIDGRNVRVVSTNGHLVATVGLKDIIVVQTSDATLVCRASSTQAVRAVVARLAHNRRLARYLS